MRLVDVAVLRHLEDLAGAGGDHGAPAALLQHLHRILDRLGDHQKQLRGKLLGNAHQMRAHLLAAAVREMRVEQVLEIAQPLGVKRQLRLLQPGLDAAVLRHHDDDEAFLVHTDQLEALDAQLFSARRDGVGRVIDDGGNHLSRLRHHIVDAGELAVQRFVDLPCLRFAQLMLFHQFVDVQAVALGRRHAARGGMRLFEISHLHKIGKLVADRCGADFAAHLLAQSLGADRFGSSDVIFDHTLEYLLFALSQFHALRSSSVGLALLSPEC